MKKIKLLLVLLLCTTSSVVAQTESAFSKMYISMQGGEVYPWGDIQDAVENTYFGGAGFRYTYWDDFDGFVMMDYSYFTPREKNEIVYGVHQVSGKLGLSWHWKMIRPLEVGGGFLCNWSRADYNDEHVDKDSFKDDPGGTLVDNETEFGWFARINLPMWTTDNYRVGFNAIWEEVWTLPKRSDMLSMGFYVERRIW